MADRMRPGGPNRIEPAVAAVALGLTGMESRVAALLAEGRSIQEVAAAKNWRRG